MGIRQSGNSRATNGTPTPHPVNLPFTEASYLHRGQQRQSDHYDDCLGMEHITFLVAVVIITALAFDFTNGFHDTANAMATSIATGALRPRVAVAISGALNLLGAFLSTEVAKTISGGIVDDGLVTPAMIFAGLVGAIVWNLLTWLFGLPSSSSHALFGGLIGAAVVGAGFGVVDYGVLVSKVILPA